MKENLLKIREELGEHLVPGEDEYYSSLRPYDQGNEVQPQQNQQLGYSSSDQHMMMWYFPLKALDYKHTALYQIRKSRDNIQNKRVMGNGNIVFAVCIVLGVIVSNLTNQQLARKLVFHDGNGS